ncbi:MAG: hypothetical protein AVDCRST_MAG30-2999 [uncultured Solirubrobacteraceae bacterium]|uniref:Uncharacterized protein n=1 Tax=uncultured Solirubrobacteraceae bacterium TaxID=1162706 RepID=A0A6J4TDZ6_9ACTN|nr:MAG: hypothetical protein AVDCRST_MAG30-2999 [uncultured Solirubrobacteraceae bacterium]
MRPLRSKRRHGATQAAVAAAVLTVAGTVAVLLRRIQPPAGFGQPRPVPDLPAHATARDEELRCECGKAYVVSGAGRHRVIWPAGSDKREALLEEECLECGRPLVVEAAA